MLPPFANELARLKVQEIEMRARGPAPDWIEPRPHPLRTLRRLLHRREGPQASFAGAIPPLVLLTPQDDSLSASADPACTRNLPSAG